jgi:2-polyprenyl-3-methyl-5-hydroxy-6-metoxy-1,4-benzoquinol methylase
MTGLTVDDGTWRYRWPAGQRMAAELGELLPLAGARVVDLGCGQGGLGNRALELGAAAVLFADGAAGSVAALAGIPDATAVRHDWGDPLPGGPWPVILAGDVLYRDAWVPALMASIRASLAPEGVALVSDPRADLGVAVAAAQMAGLAVALERRAAGYSLLRLR